MRIACIFNAAREGTTGTYIVRACRAMGIEADHWWLRDAGKIPPTYDLYLRVDHGDDYLIPLPNQLRPRIFYVFDTHLPHSWKKIRKTALDYDLMVCCHRDAARQLPGAYWLPVACDWELHGIKSGLSRTVDVAFIGTDGGVPRKFYLQALRERYPNHKIGEAPYDQMSAIYSQAQIGFNYSIADDVNMRLFEVMASGALLITNDLPSGDLEGLGFRNGETLVTYRRPKEIFEQVDYYLRNSAQRDKISQAGSVLVRGKHTYQHRCAELFSHLSKELGCKF